MRHLLQRILTANAMGLIIVLVALQTLSSGVATALRGTNKDVLFWICILAALLGLGLRRIKSNGLQAAAWIAAVGIISMWILGAGLTDPMFNLLKSVIAAGPQLLPSIGYRFDVDAHQIADTWTQIVGSSMALKLRLQNWWIGYDVRVPIHDALVRNLVWAFILWFVSAWVGWHTAQRKAVIAMLPAIFLLLEVTNYSRQRADRLWLMVFLMLLLMGVWNYRNHVAQWETRQVDYSDSIRYDSTQAVLLLAGVIGLLSFITPSISWREIRDYLRERERESQSQTTEKPSTQQNNTVPPKRIVPVAPLLPREHWLTGGFATSEKIVMTIKTGELPPVVIESITTNAPRYYWRSVVYDQYVGAGWVTSSAPPQSFTPNTPLIPGVLNKYRALHLNLLMNEPEGRIFWSGILNSADVPFTVDWRRRPQSELFPDQATLLQADMFTAKSEATVYKVDSFITTATIEDMRSASTDYPEQIRDRYLQLPPEVPERVHTLAEQITADESNPYDKAKAIESYLRTNYLYDLKISAPPQDQDVADYFLFDLKRGYCDYYATAMVVLARSSGIPARFVSGYAPGEYDAPNAQYVVRELNAHSWVEIYFPEIGWVEFEPTAAQPEIVRDETDENPIVSDENKPEKPISDFLFRLINLDVFVWFMPFLILGLLAFVYFGIIERILFLQLEPAVAMDLLYKRFYRSGRSLAGKYTQAETANEFTSKLIRKVDDVLSRFKRLKISERTRDNIQKLTNIYQASLFDDHIAQTEDVKKALHVWGVLRIQLLIARVSDLMLRLFHMLLNRIKQRGGRIT